MTALSPAIGSYPMMSGLVGVFGGRSRYPLPFRVAASLRKVTGRKHGLNSEEHHADVSGDSHMSN